jgi:phosphomannomutase
MIKDSVLESIIKAYDIRGLVGKEINEEFTFAAGSAFARFLQAEREPGSVVIGEDMRPSSAPLADAFADGITSQGLDVVRIGLASTDQLYFASGHLGLPGAMFTASHNPASYNGIKLCRAFAKPIGMDSGLGWIKSAIKEGTPIPNRPVGSTREAEMLEPYVEYLFSLFELDFLKGRELKIVIDAGNGMAGHTAPKVFERIGASIVPLYFELDGTFPHHEANPIDPENLKDLQSAVRKHDADLGLAFDGDADRCFLVDERGDLVSPSALTALIATRLLAKNPGATIIHNLITSRVVPEVVTELGGKPVQSRVGHSFIKKLMAETGAIFGGEHSGHFYFESFWRADSGMLAALHAIAALKESRKRMSQILQPFDRYRQSGEINSVVKDAKSAIAKVTVAFPEGQYQHDHLDGLTVEGEEWRFNLRPSNTEPLLRLNVEARTEVKMSEIRDQVLTLIR